MADDSSTRSEKVSLEQLTAFNDEIAALVRAGIPLELGLKQLGDSVPGAAGRLSRRIGERMSAGASLQAALDEEGDHLPGVYRAVVEAGLASGRLPEALEGVSAMARALLDLHRRIVIALIYPTIVVATTWAMLVAFTVWFVPMFRSTWTSLRLEPTWSLRFVSFLHETLLYWAAGVPLLILILMLFLGYRSTMRHSSQAGRLVSGKLHRFAWFPWVLENFDRATFTRSMSLLLKSETPLHESIVLSAWATGNSDIINDSARVAQQLQQGESLQVSLNGARRIPVFLRWMMASGERNGNLAYVLETAGDVYLKRAHRQAEFLKSVLPVGLTIVIGGTATFLYGLVLFAPVLHLYGRLAEPLV